MNIRAFIVAVLGVALLLGLFVLLRPDAAEVPDTAGPVAPAPSGITPSEETRSPAEPGARVAELVISAGEVEGPSRVSVGLGEEAALRVEADVRDTVHVHGYDVARGVSPGEPALITFRADIPGIFEVELEDAGLLVTTLEVRP